MQTDPSIDQLALAREQANPRTPGVNARHTELLKQLRRDLETKGFFDPSWRWTLALMFWIPALFGSYVAMLVLPLSPLWVALSLVGSMGMLFFGFVGHDCGHYGLSRKPWVNDFWGQFGMSVVAGMSFGWWRYRHNEHHIHCQERAGDPDMQFGVLFSVYPESANWKTPLGRFFLRIQRYSFWPLTSFYWAALRYDAVRDLFQQPKFTRVDRWFVPLHFVLFWALPIYFVGWKAALLPYLACSCISSVATAAVFVPNHIGMRYLEPGEKLSYLEQQVSTSRNVTNPAFFDFFFGGLNFQIEHHLFPRVDSHRLRELAPVVRDVCAKNGISYYEQPFLDALGEVGRHLGRMTEAYVTSRSGTALDGEKEQVAKVA